jgi:hypothetical protein
MWPNVPPATWGPRGWHWLHTTAINYSHTPTRRDARDVFTQIWRFVTQLPCIECRTHAVTYVRAHPPNLKNNSTLQNWAWQFHNNVNMRLNKPALTFGEYRQVYSDEISWTMVR